MDRHKSSNLKRHKDPFVWIPLNIFLRILSRLVNSLSVNKILDVGCGEGLIIEYLISKNKDLSIEGVDISSQAIAMAGQLCPSSSFRQGDICNIDYRDKSFDLILAIEVLEHLVNPEKAISEAHRISRKYCIFSVPLEPYFSMCNLLRGKIYIDGVALRNTYGDGRSNNSAFFYITILIRLNFKLYSLG